RVYSRFGIRRIKEMIARNAERQGWLVLYTHDVTDRPSPYGCTPGEFREVLQCAVQSRADVLSIAEATTRFRMVEARWRWSKVRCLNRKPTSWSHRAVRFPPIFLRGSPSLEEP